MVPEDVCEVAVDGERASGGPPDVALLANNLDVEAGAQALIFTGLVFPFAVGDTRLVSMGDGLWDREERGFSAIRTTGVS